MAEEIAKNFVYLAENLSNLQEVLTYCVQDEVITNDEKERIMVGETSLDRNSRFFDSLIKSDREGLKINIIKTLRMTTNGHCADIIEGVETHAAHKKPNTSFQVLTVPLSHPVALKKRVSERILDSKWWPEEKHLPKTFLERENEGQKLIDIVKDNLSKSKNRWTVINQGPAVSGMGGVGKTTIAKWFAIDNQNNYDHIIWIDCGEDSLFISFDNLTRKLRYYDHMKLSSMAGTCFSKLEAAKCLFIFDNAECYQGPQGIRDILPKHDNFHTIITSRTTRWGSESGNAEIPEMHLNVFCTKDSIDFLKKNLNDIQYTENQLKELSELLGNLPLAVQLTVPVIKSKKLSIDEYIERNKQTDDIINPNFDDYEKTISKPMKISLDIIKNHEEDPQQTAYKILQILGYVKPDFIPTHLFQAVENLQEIETKEAMKLLEKYSLMTINSSSWGRKWESCSIHRLLQEVIRHNGKENKTVVLKKILSAEGFFDYKLLPFLYAGEETQCLFPNVRGRFVEQKNLEQLIIKRRYSEALEISRMVKDTLKTPTAEYNYAWCLEKMDKLVEAECVLKALHTYLPSTNKDRDIKERLLVLDQIYELDKIEITEIGLWNFELQIEPELVNGLLFLVYSRQGMADMAYDISNQDRQLIICATPRNLDYIIKYLKNLSIDNYLLKNSQKFLFVKLGNGHGKEITLCRCAFSEILPNNLNELSLTDVTMLNEEGHEIDHYDVSTIISSNLRRLEITCYSRSTKFAIQINENLHYCDSIVLNNCIIQLQNNSRRISPTQIKLNTVSFKQNEKEIKNICLNDWIDFQKTKSLTLKGDNMSMKLDETLTMNDISLISFNNFDWNSINCSVKSLRIKRTDVPIFHKSIALRINELSLNYGSAPLASIFFLSQSANKIELKGVRIKIDDDNVKRKMGLCSAEVELDGIRFIRNSRLVYDMLFNTILDFTKIQRLKLEDYRADLIFDFKDQFSIDHLELIGVKLVNWSKSTSSVKTLKVRKVNIRDISSCQFRVTDTLHIEDSQVEVTSLDNISALANKVVISKTTIDLDNNLDTNKSVIKTYCINGKVKELQLQEITFLKDGEEVENILINDFVDIYKLSSLDLQSKCNNRSCITLSMNSFPLKRLSLENVIILNWEKR